MVWHLLCVICYRPPKDIDYAGGEGGGVLYFLKPRVAHNDMMAGTSVCLYTGWSV